MSLIAILVSANFAVTAPMLILEKVRSVDDPRTFDLRDDANRDRGVPMSCSLTGKTTVTLSLGADATLEVERGGMTKRIVVENVRGLRRSTLVCGDGDDFYYANPRRGQVYAYSADRLFRGDDAPVWSRRVAPFTSHDDAHGVMANTSVATMVQVRQNLVLVEWFFRKNGETGFWHQVFDAATGRDLGKIGPSDLLLKTNDHDPWWVLFQGGGNDTVNYVPRSIYRLRFGPPIEGSRPATDVLDALRAQPRAQPLKPVAKLSPNPVINHMISLLTPLRSASEPKVEFCPQFPALRAKYWLGQEYDEDVAESARDILLHVWADTQIAVSQESPINAWFQAEIAPTEPMKTVLTGFNPYDDRWIARYQEALLALAGPTLNQWYKKYGRRADPYMLMPEKKEAP